MVHCPPMNETALLPVLTPEIIKKAKAIVDSYTGCVSFDYENISYSVITRKGIKAARDLALAGKRIICIKFKD